MSDRILNFTPVVTQVLQLIVSHNVSRNASCKLNSISMILWFKLMSSIILHLLLYLSVKFHVKFCSALLKLKLNDRKNKYF